MVNVIPLFKRQTIKNLVIDDDLDMGDYSVHTKDLLAEGNGSFAGDVNIDGDLSVNGSIDNDNLVMSGNCQIDGNLTVNGTITCPQLKNTYTISPLTTTQSIVVPASTTYSGYPGAVPLITMPPNITISGSIKSKSSNSSIYIWFLDVNGKLISYDNLGTEKVINVPAGTNTIRLGNSGSGGSAPTIYCWKIE